MARTAQNQPREADPVQTVHDAAAARQEAVQRAADRAYDVWRNRPNRAAYVREALLHAAGEAYDAATQKDQADA